MSTSLITAKCEELVINKTFDLLINQVQKMRVRHFAKGLLKSIESKDFSRVHEILSGEFAEKTCMTLS